LPSPQVLAVFTVDAANVLWITDITEHPTLEQGVAQSRFCWSWARFGMLPQAEGGE
jgi:hypothetical protein